MALHARKSGAIEHISAVSTHPVIFPLYSAQFVQSHTGNRYNQHSTGIRCCQGDNFAEHTQRFGYIVSAAAPGGLGLCCPIAFFKSILWGALSDGPTMLSVTQVISSRVVAHSLALHPSSVMSILPSFLIPLYTFDTFTPHFTTYPSQIHTTVINHCPPSGCRIFVPCTWRRQTLLLPRHLHPYVYIFVPK